MSNILICLEKLGIGGVETAVVNQAIAFKKKGNNVYVMAENGIYSEKLNQEGIQTIDFKFELNNNICIDNEQEILSIINKYNINQIHIHQFACIQYIWKICIEKNIPYFAYVHSISMVDFPWFFNTYPIYKIILEPYFKCAQKIIVLSKEAIENHRRYFKTIELSKYYILPNCINFETYTTQTKVNKIEKFVLISRFSKEKMDSVKNAIDLFTEFSKLHENISLDIIGGGKEESVLKEYIEQYSNIKLLGESNEIEKIIDKYDVVIGIGRCILEAIAMKKIAILSGIEKLKGIITPENIEKISLRNFVGRELQDADILSIVNELNELNPENINNIITRNYDIIKKDLNINEKISYIEQTKTLESFSIILQSYVDSTNILLKELDEEKRKGKEVWDAKIWLEEQLNIRTQEKEELLKENKDLKEKKGFFKR